MHPYVRDLLLKFKDRSYRSGEVSRENLWESGKTVSSAAYEEAAERLTKEHFSGLIEFYENNPGHEDQSDVLFMIEMIAKNSKLEEARRFLFDLNRKSKDGRVVATTLNFFTAHYNELEDIYPIEGFLKHLGSRAIGVKSNLYNLIDKSRKFKNKKAFFLERIENEKSPDKISELLGFLFPYAEADLLPVFENMQRVKVFMLGG